MAELFSFLNDHEVEYQGIKYLYKNTELYTIRPRDEDPDYDADEEWIFDAWKGTRVTDFTILSDFASLHSIPDSLRENLASNFTKCIKGYHLVNDDPIKESPWEDINAIVLNASNCAVASQSKGSHKPGSDLTCSFGGLSNKSTQYDTGNKSFKISSYRLTTVCSDKNPGKIENILAEIESRKNFTYYSIIVRQEKDTEILYDWYLVPSNFPALNPSSYVWHPKLGKTGKNKGVITGWETDPMNGSSMSITFSMSSQLWMDIHITDELKKYIVGSCSVTRGRKYNYIQLYENDSSV